MEAAETRDERLTRYLVELSTPESGWVGIQELVGMARLTSDEHVRFLRSVFVPEDDACFLLYEGPSPESVRDAARRAQLGVRRVVAALRLNPADQTL